MDIFDEFHIPEGKGFTTQFSKIIPKISNGVLTSFNSKEKPTQASTQAPLFENSNHASDHRTPNKTSTVRNTGLVSLCRPIQLTTFYFGRIGVELFGSSINNHNALSRIILTWLPDYGPCSVHVWRNCPSRYLNRSQQSITILWPKPRPPAQHNLYKWQLLDENNLNYK